MNAGCFIDKGVQITNAHGSTSAQHTGHTVEARWTRGTSMNWSCHVIAGILAGLVLAVPAAADQQVNTADAIRGGWVADVEGTRHIFILKVSDTTVTGIYCAVDCGDPARLVFVDNGKLTADGVRLQLLRVQGHSTSRSEAVGRLVDSHLLLTLTPTGAHPKDPPQLDLHRDSRKPALVRLDEIFARRGIKTGQPLLFSGSSTPYVPAGSNEALSPTVLEGLWVWGNGAPKQHFMFRRVGERMLGAVCGPCDNPYTFGVLDNIVIHGDSVTFDIEHQDWGIGIEYGPFANHGSATLSRHELHLRTVAHNGPRTVEGDMVLTGPLRTEP
jgi:hypothetical protein